MCRNRRNPRQQVSYAAASLLESVLPLNLREDAVRFQIGTLKVQDPSGFHVEVNPASFLLATHGAARVAVVSSRGAEGNCESKSQTLGDS